MSDSACGVVACLNPGEVGEVEDLEVLCSLAAQFELSGEEVDVVV